MKKYLFILGFLCLHFLFVFCGSDSTKKDPFINIENGQFDLQAVVLDTFATSPGPNLGSGSLSFKFSGDINGTFSISGSLVENQSETEGVGAIISLTESFEFDTYFENFSMLGFDPKENGKADVFALISQVALDSIATGEVYGIGPFTHFTAALFKGINISDFWAGEKNFATIADQAFLLTDGALIINFRKDNHVVGTFVGTTDANQGSFSKRFILP